MNALLDIRDLDLSLDVRPPLRLLRRVSLQVGPGQIVGLVGESGAGKTMVSRVVLGIAPANVRERFLHANRQLRDALMRDFDRGLEHVFSFAGARCDRIVAGVLGRTEELPPGHS